MNYQVLSDKVKYTEDYITSEYEYKNSEVTVENGVYKVKPQNTKYTFRTGRKVPKLGILLVGLGGNNGTTIYGGIRANQRQLKWQSGKGERQANFYGSITQSSTTKVGIHGTQEIFMTLKDILPICDPNKVVISGWDISSLNLGDAMKRAGVLDQDLQSQLYDEMKKIKPMPGIYYADYIAANQEDRANNIIPGNCKIDHMEQIRQDIRDFKQANNVDKVVVLWTANTERYSKIKEGVHDTAENVLKALKNNEHEIAPSTIYAIASILEGTSFINGSPQNTLVPGVIKLAEENQVLIIGDDFKSGQTKYKTAMADFLINAGIKPISIQSYNHLGNNDGKNLSSQDQFRSKEISKSSCVDDMIANNKILYPQGKDIDHTVVIKYTPTTGDSKKAIDEYLCDIFMGGKQTFFSYNVCEDSLLAAPIILDLILLTELFQRIEWKKEGMTNFEHFHVVLSTLGYLCKAPLTIKEVPLVNSLFRQKNGIENIFKICAGIPTDDNTLMEYRCTN